MVETEGIETVINELGGRQSGIMHVLMMWSKHFALITAGSGSLVWPSVSVGVNWRFAVLP